jgi:hypothetical protein
MPAKYSISATLPQAIPPEAPGECRASIASLVRSLGESLLFGGVASDALALPFSLSISCRLRVSQWNRLRDPARRVSIGRE